MGSPAQYPTVSSPMPQAVSHPIPRKLPSKGGHAPASFASQSGVTALSVEFVAKPQEAPRVQSTIPAALAVALAEVAGFAGCLVMVSDQEARLVTVVTLWAGEDRQKRCGENARWVQKLLGPYVDRCLRVQTLVAHLPVLTVVQPPLSKTHERLAMRLAQEADETVCVA